MGHLFVCPVLVQRLTYALVWCSIGNKGIPLGYALVSAMCSRAYSAPALSIGYNATQRITLLVLCHRGNSTRGGMRCVGAV